MSEQSFEAGDRVWWLYEDARRYSFTAEVPAVIRKVLPKTVSITVANFEGRSMSLSVKPDRLRKRTDT